MKYIYFNLILVVLLIGNVSANLGSYAQNDCIPIVTTLNDSKVTLGPITSPAPNSSIILNNVTMTDLGGGTFNYTFCTTSKLGVYTYGYCGTSSGCYSNTFEVTGNGNPYPSGIVIIGFSILFLILIGVMTYLAIYSLGHAVSLDFDVIDLAWNYGAYFVFVSTYMLVKTYLGNPDIINFLGIVVDVGILVAIVLPTIYFILTLTVGSWMQRRVKGVDM